MRFAQTIPSFGRQGLQITVDILNFANLLNSEWGSSMFINNQSETLLSRSGTTDTNGHVLLNSFARKTNVFSNADLGSRYQIQIGAKYSL